MKEIINMMFALLRSVLCAEELDKSIFVDLNDEKLELLYKLSMKHSMAHIVGTALINAGLLNDSDIAKKFTKQQLVAVHRYENFEYELGVICNTLEKAEIPYIPLKGSVIRALYPEPWMRTSCDIDVLVHEEDIDRAVEALVRNGYTADEKRNFHDISLRSTSGVHLELHFSIKENRELLDPVLSQVWSYTVPNDVSVRYEMTTEFMVFYTIAHMSYHFVSGGCGIRPFADLWYINQKLDFDDEKVISLCRQSEIADFYEAVKMLMNVWYAGSKHNELTLRMERYIITGGVYGTQELYTAVKQQELGGKAAYTRSILFLPYESLKIMYPSLKNRAQAPFYQIKRWMDILSNRDRAEKSIKKLKKSVSLKKDKVNEVGQLLDDLNLNNRKKER